MTFIIYLIAYLVIGIVSGVIGGLLGIGGGSITVPALLLVFSFLDFPKEHVMQFAVGTSLASMVINTFSSLYFHNKKQGVSWPAIKKMLPSVIIGSILGALMARHLPSDFLASIFGFFVCAVGIYLAKPLKLDTKKHLVPGIKTLSVIGAGVSSLSSILGIGGGVFLFPILTYYGFEAKKAVGTSVTISFFIALFGTIGYVTKEITLEKWCLGYVYLPAFFIIGISSFVSAAYGVKLSHSIDSKTLRKIFSASLIIIGLVMIVS